MAEAVTALFAIRYLELLERRALRRERVFRCKQNAFELSEDAFKGLFRLPKHLAIKLIEDLRPRLPEPSRVSALDTETRVLAALRFFATGSTQRAVGQNLTLCLCQRSVSRSVVTVSQAMSTHLYSQWITFPRDLDELQLVKDGFKKKYDFPGVMGVIDCSHIAILAPSSSDEAHQEHAFVNREGYHSINVQMVADSNMCILNVNAKFPGSNNNSFIWEVSILRQRIMTAHNRGAITNSWLIGDSCYPLEPWLLTPIDVPESGDEVFNTTHSKIHPTIRHTFGVLKSVWQCLQNRKALYYTPKTAGEIIISCAILHNMFVKYNLVLPEPVFEIEVENPPFCPNVSNDVDEQHRNALATQGRKIQQLLIHKNFRLP